LGAPTYPPPFPGVRAKKGCVGLTQNGSWVWRPTNRSAPKRTRSRNAAGAGKSLPYLLRTFCLRTRADFQNLVELAYLSVYWANFGPESEEISDFLRERARAFLRRLPRPNFCPARWFFSPRICTQFIFRVFFVRCFCFNSAFSKYRVGRRFGRPGGIARPANVEG